MEPEQAAASGERERAPGRLALVQDLINSYEVDGALEALPDPAALAAWLRERGLIAAGEQLGDGDLERARGFREALRALLDERAHGGIRPETVAALNAPAHGASLRVAFDPAGVPRLAPAASGIEGALAELLAIIAQSSLDGTWQRLKVCLEGSCRYAFYDRSKNRSGSWCSMAACGNRAKARSYRRRHRPQAAG